MSVSRERSVRILFNTLSNRLPNSADFLDNDITLLYNGVIFVQERDLVEEALQTTQQSILAAGKEEFLQFGYEKASLRVIAKRAQVTTGAIYGYYPDKASLFDALVMEPAEVLLERFAEITQDFESMPLDQQKEEMGSMTEGEMSGWLDHIYENFDAFKLVLCKSAGSRWESYLDSLIEVEEISTANFIKRLNDSGYETPKISPRLLHMLASVYFTAIQEMISHDMSRDEAEVHLAIMRDFFTAGWERILGFS